jgi:hypothetical protein
LLLQRITNRAGKTLGLVLHFRTQGTTVTQALAPEPKRTLWKVCQICTENEALVYCRVHSVYLCLECVQAHEIMEGAKVICDTGGRVSILPSPDLFNHCEFLSRAAARALAV